MEIRLPHGFAPREYQRKAMAHFDRGGLRGVYCWPRRSGKDLTFVHQTMKAAHRRVGMYYHLLPNHKQARKVIWDAIDNDGQRVIDVAIPHELRESTNEQEMKIRLKVGSLYQLVGADYFDSIVGSNPVGLVFSEFALTDPKAWSYFRPILAGNGGWAAFISTPRGYNHFHDLLELAKQSHGWNWSHLTVHDTKHMDTATLEQERREMPDELYRQEYETDFSAANIGAILGRYLEDAEKEGRVRDDVEATGPIEISSDIGFRDTAAWWFWEARPGGFALVDYDEDTGLDAPDWIERIQEKGYQIRKIWLPHDAKAKTFQSKHSVVEQFIAGADINGRKVRGFGTDRVDIVPVTKKQDQINACRMVAQKCVFNRTRCKAGLNGLRNWSYKYDETRKVFSKEPDHDWASHPGDGFATGAVVMQERVTGKRKPTKDERREAAIKEIAKATRTPTFDELLRMHEDRQPRRARL